MNGDSDDPVNVIAQALLRLQVVHRHGRPSHNRSSNELKTSKFAGSYGHRKGGRHGHGSGHAGGGHATIRLLLALASADRQLSVSELGEQIGVDQPRASRLVAQGVERGLVARQADPGDARRTRIGLTEAGRVTVESMQKAEREHVSRTLHEFTEEEKAQFATLLARFADLW